MGLNSLTQCGHKCYLFSRPWKREGALPVTDVLKQRFHKKTGYSAVLQVLKGVWLASTPFQEAARGCDLQIKPSKETRLSVLRRLFKTLLPAVFSVGRKEAGPGSPCDSLCIRQGESRWVGAQEYYGYWCYCCSSSCGDEVSVTTNCVLKNRGDSKEKTLAVFSIYRHG